MTNFPPITIWIHGTLPEHLLPSIFGGITIQSVYTFFYCKPGLTLAKELEPKYHHYQIAKTLAEQQPALFPLDTFYTYGWPGTLDANERLRTANVLYQELQKLCDTYKKKYGHMPVIRIITHSHGGNVALNLARAHQEYKNDDNLLLIHELILLAIPVQEETAHYINDPLFTAVYSLHSHWDVLQIGDPQGWPHIKQILTDMIQANSFDTFKKALESIELRNLFSERHFTMQNKKLIQAHITHEHVELFHIEFLLLSFIKQLPGIMDQLRRIRENPPGSHEITITIP